MARLTSSALRALVSLIDKGCRDASASAADQWRVFWDRLKEKLGAKRASEIRKTLSDEQIFQDETVEFPAVLRYAPQSSPRVVKSRYLQRTEQRWRRRLLTMSVHWRQ